MKITKILSLLILIVIVLIFFFVLFGLQNSKIRKGVYFNSLLETQNFILKDSDNYIKNMSNIDLIARGYNSNESYLNTIINNILSFSSNEKKEIIELMNSIDLINFPIFTKKIPSIKFSKIDGIVYENGYPHTRYNIIFLSPSFFLFKMDEKKKILIHECIHLFQRYNPLYTEQFLNKNGFKKLGNFKYLFPDIYPLKRSNSDIDENIWQGPDGNIMFPIFSSLTPSSLGDIKDNKMEHPYEWMAYSFEDNKKIYLLFQHTQM